MYAVFNSRALDKVKIRQIMINIDIKNFTSDLCCQIVPVSSCTPLNKCNVNRVL